MICIYRYSDKGKNPIEFGYPFTKKDCWESFCKAFPNYEKIIVADNCEDISIFEGYKVIATSLGNSESAKFAIDFCIENFTDELIYLAEDDYLYKQNCENIFEEVLQYVDYATLYDHGDKYKNFNNQPNPFINWYGENTHLFRTEKCHWKLTNSTTMTFACKIDTLKKDRDLIFKYLANKIPLDFQMFLDLLSKNRTLASAVPGLSTHLSPNHDNNSPFFYV